jgi:hypothetical protein
MNREIKISFTTPCFCRGADCSENGAPEIRPPSIRGQLHWWFRALGGTAADENAIFGSVHDDAKASKIVVRVRYPQPVPAPQKIATLPHKHGGSASPKNALPAGTAFDLLISTRLGGLSPNLKQKFTRALNAWLLLGSLGLRATRGGGNFSYVGQPAAATEYETAIRTLLSSCRPAVHGGKTVVPPLTARLLPTTYTTAEDARRVLTDTLASDAFAKCNYPLGKIKPAGRKTSPLRFRIIKLGVTYRIAAIWDGRENVTGNRLADLKSAIDQLARAGKPIAPQLDHSTLLVPRQ